MAKKEITKKEELILLLLYIFRFINSKQIQEFLNHKDHRRINSWLKQLTEKEYIEKDFKQVFGTLTKPAVYNLSSKGRKYIKDKYNYYFPHYLKKIARDNKASKSFKIRCQTIADFYLTLFHSLEEKKNEKPQERQEQEIKQGNKNKKNKTTPTGIAIADYMTIVLNDNTDKAPTPTTKDWQYFTSSYFPDFILLDKIKPDAYIRKKVSGGITHGLVFVLDAYVPRFLLRYTLKRIFDTMDEEYWNDDDLASLNFYFICPNNVIITYMRRMLKSTMERYYESKELTFQLITRNQLYKRKKSSEQKIKWRIVSSEDTQ